MPEAASALNEQFRDVGVDELFFSVTDRAGHIEQANSVFARLSRYPRPELMGAAHNIIRHPDMPGGAYRLMWDLLLAGRPMAAYVKNLAKDGVSYSMFATITPVGDKFLSVRTAPCVTSLWNRMNSFYAEVRAMELAAQRSGFTAREAAEMGAQAITDKVKALGFPSYEDFIRYALPAETSARLKISALDRSHPQVDGPLGELLGNTTGINAELAALLRRLEGLQELADTLAQASRDAWSTIAGLRQATEMASQASESVEQDAPVLGRSAKAMWSRSTALLQAISTMAGQLDQARRSVLELRFRIGLTRLHNDMVTNFVIEVAGGNAPPEGLSSIPILCRALREDVLALAEGMSSATTLLREVAHEIEQAADQLREFQRDMSTWRLLVPRYRMSQKLDRFVAPIDQQLNQGHTQMSSLRQLASRCAAEATPFDSSRLDAAISQITQISAGLNDAA